MDMKSRTATLRFEDGSTEILSVRSDVDMSRHKVGEKVIFSISGKVAIDVSKP
jgi:hypothetical protein